MKSVFLKFLYKRIDGCLGAGRINVFDQNGAIIPHTKFSIVYDGFTKDTPTTNKIFSTNNTITNRWWTGAPETTYFIAELDITDITKLTKIGIRTWENTYFGKEQITVYMSHTYDGTYKQIAFLNLDASIQGTSKMVYVNTDASTMQISKTIQTLITDAILNHELIQHIVTGSEEK